jgi:hypothetical protein
MMLKVFDRRRNGQRERRNALIVVGSSDVRLPHPFFGHLVVDDCAVQVD